MVVLGRVGWPLHSSLWRLEQIEDEEGVGGREKDGDSREEEDEGGDFGGEEKTRIKKE